MTASNASEYEQTSIEVVELPTDDTGQRAIHEAVGHLYDELAISIEYERADRDPSVNELFETLEQLYVGTGEETIETVEIRYEKRE